MEISKEIDYKLLLLFKTTITTDTFHIYNALTCTFNKQLYNFKIVKIYWIDK